MPLTVSPKVAPSGQGILFLGLDGSGNQSNVTNVVDNNERQSLVVSANPSGGTFTLTFDGQTTAAIPTIPSPPFGYFQWNVTLTSPGTYDLSANLFIGGSGTPNQFYEIFDGSTLLGTATLNNAFDTRNPAGSLGGPPNPEPLVDGVLTTHDGNPLRWFPLGAAADAHPGRYTFATTALHVRVSCDKEDPAGPNAGRDGLAIDNLRIATTDGATVVRADTANPPGTLSAPGASLGTDPTGWQTSDFTRPAIEFAGTGAGVRYLADPLAVQSALEALSTVGAGNAAVTGDASPLNPLIVTFLGSLSNLAQPQMTASDTTNISVASVARGGLLPSIRVNGGTPIALLRSWLHYYNTTVSMPGCYFAFPQCPPAVTYSSVKYGDSTISGGWQGATYLGEPTGYTPNSYAVADNTSTATYLYRPVTAGQYRVSATWPGLAGYSNDVVYTVRTVAYALVLPVNSNGSTRTVTQAIEPVGNPCTVSATATGGGVLAVQVVVKGLDGSGSPVTETLPAFSVAGTSTVTGTQVFSRVISVTIPTHGTNDTTTSLSANPVTLGTHHADQTADPTGAIDRGYHWDVLGTFTLTGLNNGLAVTQSNGTSNTMIADAVRFERLSADTSIRIADTDTVTYSAGAGWITGQAGTAPAATDVAVTNLVGQTLYPPLPTSVEMGIGYNLPGMGTNAATYVYNNLLTAVFELQDWPTVIDHSTRVYALSLPGQTFGGDNRSWPNMPTGRHVLTWDGASDLTISTQGGSVSEYAATTFPAAGGVGNKRFYDFGGDPFFYGPACFLVLHGTTATGTGEQHVADASNATLLPEGMSPETAPKFRQNVVDRFAGMTSIRCMDSTSAITGNPTTYDDIQTPPSWLSKSTAVRTVVAVPHTIKAYTGPGYAFDLVRGQVFHFTTTAPHGLSNYQLVLFQSSPPVVADLINDLGHTATFSFEVIDGFIDVIDANNFVFYSGVFAELVDGVRHPYTMVGTITDPPMTVTMSAGNGYPLRDQVDLCNTTGCSMHWNMAFSADDDCATRFGDYVARNLDPSLKLRLARSNEVWNFFSKPYACAAPRSFAFYGGSSEDPYPFTIQESVRMWGLVEAAFEAAGRPSSDVIRVIEGLYFDSSKTRTVGEYCHAGGITFHEFAVAPYLGNRPSFASGYQPATAFGPMIDRLNVDQTLDFTEYHFTYGRYEHEMPGHYNALTGALDTGGTITHSRPDLLGVKLITYEGGPETMTVGGGSGLNIPSLAHAAVRSPRWYGDYIHVLHTMEVSLGPDEGGRPTGCTLFQDYFMSGGDQGPNASYAQWAAYSHTAQLPYAPGNSTQDAIQVNQFDRIDLVQSVTGGALIRFASLLDATPTPDFSLAITGSGPLDQPGTATRTVTLTALNSYTGTAALTTGGLPSGVTPGYSPSSLTGGGTVVSTLTLTATTVTAGTSTVTVTGTDSANSLTHAATFSLVVNPADATPTVVEGRRHFGLNRHGHHR